MTTVNITFHPRNKRKTMSTFESYIDFDERPDLFKAWCGDMAKTMGLQKPLCYAQPTEDWMRCAMHCNGVDIAFHISKA
jgi:hypothetical protein